MKKLFLIAGFCFLAAMAISTAEKPPQSKPKPSKPAAKPEVPLDPLTKEPLPPDQLAARASLRAKHDEATRRKIFNEWGAAEDRAMAEAERKFPWEDWKGGNPDNYKPCLDEQFRLEEKYIAELEQKYDITSDERIQVALESIEKDWPQPEPKRNF